MRGQFFALEGIDGSGKSTQLALLARRLEEAGIPCLTTCAHRQAAAAGAHRSSQV